MHAKPHKGHERPCFLRPCTCFKQPGPYIAELPWSAVLHSTTYTTMTWRAMKGHEHEMATAATKTS